MDPSSNAFHELRQRILDKSPEPTADEIEATRRKVAEEALQREQAERSARWRSLIADRGQRYEHCTVASYECTQDGQEQACRTITGYCQSLEVNVREGIGLLLFGPAGTGKDHLLAAVMRAAILKCGLTVRWENGMDLFGEIRDRIDDEKSEAQLVRSLCHPEVLAISDPLPPFGVLSPFQANMLFRVIDGRYSQRKPTLVTMNVSSRQEAEERIGAQIVDRLAHAAVVVFCNWKSYRARKQ